MNDTPMMRAGDSVSGSLAECFITIDDQRYNFMQLYEFEASWKLNIVDVPILGKVGKGHKVVGGSGEWSGTAHYNQSVMRQLLLKYKNSGEMTYFDIQVTNEDPTAKIGRQTIVLRDCLMEGGILAKFNADEEVLSEEISGTFEDWDMPESFTLLEGMQ